MAVVIRFARHGSKRNPFYRVVAADKERPRDGKFLEVLGTYDPKEPQAIGNLKQDRIQEWISKGAKPSDAVRNLIKRTEKLAPDLAEVEAKVQEDTKTEEASQAS